MVSHEHTSTHQSRSSLTIVTRQCTQPRRLCLQKRTCANALCVPPTWCAVASTQERAADKQAELDELRARRYQETKDREWRAKEKAAAERHATMQRELEDAREAQRAAKMLQRAEMAKVRRGACQLAGPSPHALPGAGTQGH